MLSDIFCQIHAESDGNKMYALKLETYSGAIELCVLYYRGGMEIPYYGQVHES